MREIAPNPCDGCSQEECSGEPTNISCKPHDYYLGYLVGHEQGQKELADQAQAQLKTWWLNISAGEFTFGDVAYTKFPEWLCWKGLGK